MSKRTLFTTITPLPAGLTRETVMETLHSHTEMIDLNPLVEERHIIKPPPEATEEEFHCVWYSLTDRVSYLPGGLASGKVSYNACFHDLNHGLQTHVYAPMGLNIQGKWTLGGSLPGEPTAAVELGVGAPISGLYLREDVDMRCNIVMTSFVKKTLKKAHAHLVDRLVIKAQMLEASQSHLPLNETGLERQRQSYAESQGSTMYSRASYTPSLTNSDWDANSVTQESEQRYSRDAPHIPPLQHSATFSLRDSGHADFRHKTEDSMYPRALSVRSSTGSYNGSVQGDSQNGRQSYQEPPQQRSSWNNVEVGRTPSTRVGWTDLNVGKAPAQKLTQPPWREMPGEYRGGNEYRAELESVEPVPQRTGNTAHFGAVELE